MSKQYPGGIISKTPVVPSGSYSNSAASGIWTLDQQAYWQKLGQWPNANNPPIDPQFNYVTMLLHGDGTNGAQNNTFLDSGPNTFSITRNGNTTQGSFSPYGSNWSNYFDGNADYLTAPTPVLSASGNFTVECWINPRGSSSNTFVLAQFISGNSGRTGFGLSGSVVQMFLGGTTNNGTTNISYNTWTHLAFTRSGTTFKAYVNGTLDLTVTSSVSIVQENTTIGGNPYFTPALDFSGYISNLRVTNTVVYTTNFTPSTTPLTAISGTQLLTCQSNQFKDNSTNNYSLAVNEIPSVQRFNPFGASTAYSTSVIGGSGYFDGSGDSLRAPTNAVYNLGTSAFTIETYAYIIDNSANRTIFDRDSGNGFLLMYTSGSRIQFYANNIAVINFDATDKYLLNRWAHIAVVRSSNTFTLYIDGTSVATGTNAVSIPTLTNAVGIGGRSDGSDVFYGYLSSVRFSTSAVYTSNFTPPTAPPSQSGALLLNMVNGAIFDNAMMNDLETVGNAQISTSVVKYGTGSMYFDGTGDYLIGPSTPNMNFGSGDFTVEAWVYRQVDSGTTQTIYQKGRVADSNFELTFVINTSNQLEVYYSTSGTSATLVATTTASVSQNTWTHIAVTRSGSTWRVFIGGTLDVSATASVTLYTGTGRISIATNPNGDSPFTGYIDDLRITKGYARYTATFTPPTAAFPNTGPV